MIETILHDLNDIVKERQLFEKAILVIHKKRKNEFDIIKNRWGAKIENLTMPEVLFEILAESEIGEENE